MLPVLLLPLALTFGGSALADDASWACPDYSRDVAALQDLEAEASIGALSDAKKTCLEAGYKKAREQTTKNKISRVLLVNAYAYDTTYWAKLVQRHLDEVDRSDPDVAYLYSFYLYNRPDNPDFEKVIYWTEVALERKQIWSGDTYVKRVAQLQKVRALAAARLWKQYAEQQDEAKAEDARVKTKTFAREWIESNRSAGLKTAQAEALCVSAASEVACGLTGEPDEADAPTEPQPQ